ncbi:unnamed protein product [Dovyalis caffra]|uniref:Uncharacterized protein n=1 Tax=Dovyalis caffra TaxID=77055 RepID=A0AAV1QSX7_9ROSI|nr:unnamed protein product [Dovyalis caffra]
MKQKPLKKTAFSTSSLESRRGEFSAKSIDSYITNYTPKLEVSAELQIERNLQLMQDLVHKVEDIYKSNNENVS